MLICWCGCGPSSPVQGGGTPPSVLSFCPWIKQLPLSLFSHGSRRSVHASPALAKAFQSACSLCSTSQGTDAGQHLSRAEPSVDVSVFCYGCCVCYLCLSVCVCVRVCARVCVSISIQTSSHMDNLSLAAATMASVGSGACTAAKTHESSSHCFWMSSVSGLVVGGGPDRYCQTLLVTDKKSQVIHVTFYTLGTMSVCVCVCEAEIHSVTMTVATQVQPAFLASTDAFQWRVKMAVITMLLTAPRLKLEQAGWRTAPRGRVRHPGDHSRNSVFVTLHYRFCLPHHVTWWIFSCQYGNH